MTWNNGETLSRDSLTTLSNNQDWLKSNMAKTRYIGSPGFPQRDGAKILAGISYFPGTSGSSLFYIPVSFGDYFSPDCYPVVTTALRSVGEDRLFHRIYALDGSHWITSSGFMIAGYAYTNPGWDKNTVDNLHVDYIAVGY